MSVSALPVGDHLREWRRRRRMSQLDLACEADISTRHLSFVETGRSTPSREMILHLAEQLEIPARERNVLLVAAGYAPLFPERALSAPELTAARTAIDILLEGHKPYPAFALDRHWDIVASNNALPELYEGVAAELLKPPVNVLRLSLHPAGLAPKIVNFGEWRAHLLSRLRRQIDLTADAGLIALLAEVTSYANAPPVASTKPHYASTSEVMIPFRLRMKAGVVSFFSTVMVFGTPTEITLSELALESFFPMDDETTRIIRSLTT